MATTTETQVDVQVTGEGTIFLFDLRTEKAREWVAENVGGDELLRREFGGRAQVRPRSCERHDRRRVGGAMTPRSSERPGKTGTVESAETAGGSRPSGRSDSLW